MRDVCLDSPFQLSVKETIAYAEDHAGNATVAFTIREGRLFTLRERELLFQKVNFLMQAAMGFINIEQNRIIKIFSVVSVVFLPPTLAASSYGMNFAFMPELKWSWGYPAAIGLMILAGLTPYLYFKRKNWL